MGNSDPLGSAALGLHRSNVLDLKRQELDRLIALASLGTDSSSRYVLARSTLYFCEEHKS